MKILSIEAAASPPSVALSVDGEVLERLCEEPRPQAEHLLALVEQLLAESNVALGELDGIAVGRGPGSFTGLRVAAATAQGLAYSSGVNIASVSTLASLAHQVLDVDPVRSGGGSHAKFVSSEPTVLVCLDARKAQVYCALYQADELDALVQVSPERVMDPAEVVAQFKGRVHSLVGNAFSEYPELNELATNVIDVVPSAFAVAVRANSGAVEFEAPFLAVPEYVRNNVTHGS